MREHRKLKLQKTTVNQCKYKRSLELLFIIFKRTVNEENKLSVKFIQNENLRNETSQQKKRIFEHLKDLSSVEDDCVLRKQYSCRAMSYNSSYYRIDFVLILMDLSSSNIFVIKMFFFSVCGRFLKIFLFFSLNLFCFFFFVLIT